MNAELQTKKIVFFDGVCHFCQGSVQFILKRNQKQNLFFASLQSKESREFLAELTEYSELPDSIVFYENGRLKFYSDALLGIARELDFPWNLALGLKIVPAPIRNYLYKAFAKRRYQFFGKSEACMLPTPAQRKRFL